MTTPSRKGHGSWRNRNRLGVRVWAFVAALSLTGSVGAANGGLSGWAKVAANAPGGVEGFGTVQASNGGRAHYRLRLVGACFSGAQGMTSRGLEVRFSDGG